MSVPPVAPASAPVSLLLVDDEARNLDVLESLLSSPEYHLVRAQTAEQALMLLLEGEFAAIVLDIQMPNMNGIELATLIKQRKRTQHIPIIFLTAYFQEDKDVLQGYGSGAVDYLTKPINPQILRSKIAVFVDLFRKTRALSQTNAALETEIAQRQKAEQALREMNVELEARVQARTADLVQLNQELALARDRALAASGAKDDFLARLSHELRTPLNPVLLLASEAAGNQSLPPDIRADFGLIAENVALEARLIDDLLDLTRISRGKLVLEMRNCDVHALLHDTIGMVQAELTRKQLALSLELGAANPLVRGDDVRLKQIFWNVLSNAAKFTPENGRVVVETFVSSESRIAIRVTDSGHGMTTAELARIFEAFSQGDHAVEGAHRYGGLGLGLAISRTLVELHHGAIRAASAGRGKGTTFTIEFPSIPESTPDGGAGHSHPAYAAHGSIPGGGRRRVLLVDDHQPTRMTLANLLSRRHFDVVTADCLAEARALAAKGRFDLLISDIGLPDGSGYDLMRSLHGSSGMIGIALTGYGMEEDIEKSRSAGFISHLTKPVSMQALDFALADASRELDAR